MLPQALYWASCAGERWMLTAKPDTSTWSIGTSRTVTDHPWTTLVSGHFTGPGAGHDPVWMCAGSFALRGSPTMAIVTRVLPDNGNSVTVPCWPERPIALILKVSGCFTFFSTPGLGAASAMLVETSATASAAYA